MNWQTSQLPILTMLPKARTPKNHLPLQPPKFSIFGESDSKELTKSLF